MVPSKEGGKNIPDLGGLRTGALIFFVTVYVNSTFCHPLGGNMMLQL